MFVINFSFKCKFWCNFVAEIQIFSFFMVKKMVNALKKRYSNLGLSDEIFSSVAPMAIIGLSDDADESALDARAGESYVESMLKTFQSQMDKIRTDAKKKRNTKDDNKGDDDLDNAGDGKLDEILSLLNQQRESNEALQNRLAALESADKAKSFDETVSRIAKELKIPSSVLGLCKAGLSPEMEESAIRDSLGASKQVLVNAGVSFSDGGVNLTENEAVLEAKRKEASDWVERNAIK